MRHPVQNDNQAARHTDDIAARRLIRGTPAAF